MHFFANLAGSAQNLDMFAGVFSGIESSEIVGSSLEFASPIYQKYFEMSLELYHQLFVILSNHANFNTKLKIFANQLVSATLYHPILHFLLTGWVANHCKISTKLLDCYN